MNQDKESSLTNNNLFFSFGKNRNWTEKTDPRKFVYEDIAIASYLLCLWKEEEIRLKRCGL
jgi:hypothetical protein